MHRDGNIHGRERNCYQPHLPAIPSNERGRALGQISSGAPSQESIPNLTLLGTFPGLTTSWENVTLQGVKVFSREEFTNMTLKGSGR